MADRNPAALNIVNALQSLRKTVSSSGGRVDKTVSTVANSLDELNQLFKSSRMFKKTTVKSMATFFKQAPALINTLNSNLSGLNQSTALSGSDIKNLNTTLQEQPAFLEDLTDQLNSFGTGLDEMQGGLKGVEVSAQLNPETQRQFAEMESDLGSIHSEIQDVMNAIASSGNVTGGAAQEVGKLSGSMSDMVRQLSVLTKGGQINAKTYMEITRRISTANQKLNHTRIDMGKLNKDLEKTVDLQDEAGDGIKKGVDALVMMGAFDLFKGVQTGEAVNQISSLNDELIEFKRLTGSSNEDLKVWQDSAISTAKILNKLGVAADPAEIADLYNIIRKTGIRGAEDIKALSFTVKQLSDATNISKEEVADFAQTVTKRWGGSIRTVGLLSSAFIALQRTTGASAKELMDKTQELGKTFTLTMSRLSKRGKETFAVDLAAAAGAFKDIGLDSTALLEDMNLALTEPGEAAKKFGHILQGTGYTIQQMAKDLEKGNIDNAMKAIAIGTKKYANMSTVQLGIIAQTYGNNIEDLALLSQKGGKFFDIYIKSIQAGTKEFANSQGALAEAAKVENEKIGNLFERVGKRIKTWIAGSSVKAMKGFGVNLLELAPKLALLVIVADKMGLRMDFLAKGMKKAGGMVLGYVGNLLGLTTASAGATAATGTATVATTTFGTALSAAIWPVTAIVVAIAGLWALFKYGPTLMDKLAKRFPQWEEGFMAIKDGLLYVKQAFINMWKTIEPYMKAFGKVWWSVVVLQFKVGWSIIKTVGIGLITTFKMVWAIAGPILIAFAKGIKYLWSILAESEGIQKTKEMFQGWLTGAKAFMNILPQISQSITNFFSWVQEKLSTAGEFWSQIDLAKPFRVVYNVLGDVIKQLNKFLRLGSKVQEIGGFVKKFGSEKIQKVGGFVKKLWPFGRDKEAASGMLPPITQIQKLAETQGTISAIPGISQGSKVISPEPGQKIFAESPNVVLNPKSDIDVHQEDVVAAIKTLTNTIKQGQIRSTQSAKARRPRGEDQQTELVSRWDL